MMEDINARLKSEFETIILFNPTSEDFTQNYNGEPYVIKAKETKAFAQFIGFHIAKHLATKIVKASFSYKERCDPKKTTKVTQHLVYDNPRLRIALYQILQDVQLVQKVVMVYPYKGFIGEMDEYKKYVEGEEAKEKKEKEKKNKGNVKSEVKQSSQQAETTNIPSTTEDK